jgi:flagellar protein FliL
MSEEATAPDEGTEKKKKGLPPFLLPLVLALVGTGAGGFVGAKVVGPKLTAGFADVIKADDAAAKGVKRGAHVADSTDETASAEAEAEGEAAKGGGEHGGEKSAPPLYTLSDLVLNPAGSGGTRFLMLSVAFDMKDSSAVDALKARDAEIKDAVLALVGSKTVDQLADVASREPLKVEIRDLVAKITKKPKAIKRVSFPQFVIQ